ncbi:hypothetical protein [Spirosoma arcticum]
MRTFIRNIIGLGDYLMSLSDRARQTIVLVALLMLGGGGVYKLVVSIQDLGKPLPAASPDQFMKPMQKLFVPQPDNNKAYRQARQELDSLRNRSFTPTTLPR